MYKCTQFLPFLQTLFDTPEAAWKASRITTGIIRRCSPCLSDIVWQMVGKEAANYKVIQRFLKSVDCQSAWLRLFQGDAPFVIGDVTKMP